MDKFVDLIECRLDELGWSRYKLSQVSGVEQNTIKRLMTRTGGINAATLDRLANALGLRLKLERRCAETQD